MGNSAAKERFEKAGKTKILTAEDVKLDDWDDIVKLGKDLPKDVRTFNVARNQLKDPLPRKLLELPCVLATVRVLDLSDNKLADVAALAYGLADFATAPAAKATGELLRMAAEDSTFKYPLETLNLAGNRIQALPAFAFLRFPKLKQLNLSRNALVSPSSPEQIVVCSRVFCGTPSLVSLNLSGNNFIAFPLFATDVASGDPTSALASLPKLMELDLQGNALRAVASNGASLPALKSLDIGGQQDPKSLASIDESIFVDFPKMSSLGVEKTANREKIFGALHGREAYQAWIRERASDVNRQLASGLRGKMAE